MTNIAGLALSKASSAFSQLQQRLGDRLYGDPLQGLSKHLDGQLPQVVNEAMPGGDGSDQPVPLQNRPPIGLSVSTNPAYLNYYGSSRPLTASYAQPYAVPLLSCQPEKRARMAGYPTYPNILR